MNFLFLQMIPLFRNCSVEEIKSLDEKVLFLEKEYKKDELIFRRGDIVEKLGIVESGSVIIENTDIWAYVSVLGIVEKGGIFGESYACVGSKPLMVDVKCKSDCKIVFVNISRLMKVQDLVSSKVIKNLLVITSNKNMNLSRRAFYTSSKTIRGKLMAYFSDQVEMQKTKDIVVPFDRQQMADFLNVERTALCKELGKMEREGLIQYRKNQFRILNI